MRRFLEPEALPADSSTEYPNVRGAFAEQRRKRSSHLNPTGSPPVLVGKLWNLYEHVIISCLSYWIPRVVAMTVWRPRDPVSATPVASAAALHLLPGLPSAGYFDAGA